MSRIIGVLNLGGAGKTTTVVNLAVGLALRGARVLCIDLDAQSSLAAYLGVRYTYSLTHLLLGQAEPQACIVQARDNLDLIASDSGLLQAEGELWRMGDNRAARQVMNYLALMETRQVLQTPKTIGQIPKHHVRLSPIVPTFYYARLRKDREVMETLQRHFAGKVAEPIRANVRLSEAPSHQMSICEVERVVNGD